MKNAYALPMILLTTFLVSCKTPYKPPKGEICVTGDNYEFACSDPRLPKGEQDYFRPYKVNDILTNPTDYGAYYNYCMGLREKLIRCESRK